MKQKFLGVSATVALLGVVSFITDLSSEMMMPLLPLFITTIGGTGVAIGLIGGLGDGLSSVLQVFSGYWSDRSPRRKPFIIAGYAASSVFKLLIAVSLVWQQVLGARLLERVGKGLRSAPRDAVIADCADENARGRAFGLHRSLDTAGAVAGSVAALALFWFLGLELRSILIAAALVGFAALLPLRWVKERPRQPCRTPLSITWKGLSPSFKLLLAASSVFGLANFTYMFFILRARDFFVAGTGAREAAAVAIGLYVVYNVVYSLVAMPVGALSDRIGRRRVLMAGYLLFALTCLGFSLVGSWWVFLILFALYGVVHAAVETCQRAFASDCAGDETRGGALGMLHTCTGLAVVFGSLIAGQLWDRFGPSATFVYGGAVAVAALVLLVLVAARGHDASVA
jgi:MFS family permease